MHMIILWLHIFNRCNRWYLYGMYWGLFLEGWGVSYGMNWVLALAYCYVLIVKVFELNYYNMLLKYRSNIAINFTLLLIHITIIYSILGLKIVINLWVLPWVHTWQIWPRRRCGFWLLYRIWWRRHIDELVCRRRCSGATQHHRWRVVYEQKFNRICVLRVHTHKRVQCYHKDAHHAKGWTVHRFIEHDLFHSAVTFQNVCVVPGDLLLKQKVPLWNVQKITQMMLVRHFENEKTFSLNGKIQLGRDGLTLIVSNAT